MKKVLSVILVVMLIFTAMPLGAFNLTASAATEGYYTYSVSGGKATITDVDTAISGDIVIPNTLGGYEVTKIGDRAFQSCRKITGVTIPNTVTTIGEYAFDLCSAMIYVEVPDSITSMGESAFNRCSALEIVYMEDLAAWCNIDFTGYPSNPLSSAEYIIIDNTLIFDLVIPDTVTTIKSCAFAKCVAVETVSIPSSVTTIENNAFAKCSELRSVNLSNGITSIETYAFEACTSLKSITIPESLNAIESCTFIGCTSLSKLYITDKLSSIGWRAFNDCTSLKSVYFLGDDKPSVSINSTGNDPVINATWYCTCRNHLYDNSCDTTCNRCTTTRSITHTYNNNCDIDCNVCGFVRAVPDHIYTNSCDTSCNECGFVRTITHTYDNDCDEVCNVCNEVREVNHSYDKACDAYCNLCGCERVPSDHIYSGVCDADCNVCGFIRTVPDHTYSYDCDATCDICGYERVPFEHVYSGVCDTDCNECGYVRSAPAHTYSDDCDITCDICGYERVPFDHVYSNACDTNCNVCGFIRTVPDHVYTAVCDTVCNICGFERVALDHTYNGECDTDCNVCGYVRIVPDHTYSNDCDATCNVCSYERTPSDHVYSGVCDSSCNECGAERVLNHVYDNNCDAYCNECGNVRTPPHAYDNICDTDCNDCEVTRVTKHIYEWVIDKAANCNETGLKHEECINCHIKKSQDTVIPKTHVYDSLYDSTCNLCGLTSQATQKFSGGHGTESSPYLISTKAQLDQVRNYLTAHFKLICDITFTSSHWLPIGTSDYQYNYNYFTGSFDGNGFTIKNLWVDNSVGAAGLFGYNKGVIKNLFIENCTLSAYGSGSSYSSASAYAGGIVAQNSGTIINCYVIGTVSASASAIETYAYVGGIAGYNKGTVANCYSVIKLSGSTSTSYYEYGGCRGYTYVGGIVGENSKTIINCHSAGNVSSSAKTYASQVYGYAYAGGIVGNNSGTITNCYTTSVSTVTSATYAYIGAIAARSSGTISNCYFLNNMEKGVGSGTNNTTKCTAAQLAQQSTYVGFDFENDWVWDESLQLYPSLRNLHYHTYDNSCDTTCNTCDASRTITHTFTDNCDAICNVCGLQRTPPHDYVWVIDKNNNCGVDGIKHEVCSTCHIKRNENTVIPATGEHTFEWIIDKGHNCGVDGFKHEECKVCHTKRNEYTIIPATGNHVFDDDSDKICNYCGQVHYHITFINYDGTVYKKIRIKENTISDSLSDILTRSGYNFAGWSTTKTGNVEYNINDELIPVDSMTLYAQWNKHCSVCAGDGIEDYKAKCSYCSGSGYGSSYSKCTNCSGSGSYQTTVSVTCTSCSGSGNGTSIVKCSFCYGNGSFCSNCGSASITILFGATVCSSCYSGGRRTCGSCNGAGKWTTDDCSTCGGDGTLSEKKVETCSRCSGSGSARDRCTHCSYGYNNKTRACATCNETGEVIRTDLSAPEAPIVESIISDTIVLKTIKNGEYSIDGINWQDSPTFTGLESGKSYTFYQRYAKTDTTNRSDVSAPLEILAHNHIYDNNCDVSCNLCDHIRTITHDYKTVWDKDDLNHWHECSICNDKTNVEQHVYDNACDTECGVCGQTRTVPDHSYTLNGNHTCDICKYSKTPGKPVIESKINFSVTLVLTNGFEYSKDGITWQTGNLFEGLLPNTTYTFYQRVKATSTALVSDISEGVTIALKSAQGSVPSAPVILSFTDVTVTLMPTENCEYSFDGVNWQSSNVFEGLLPGTKYNFYQRYVENDLYEASNKSLGASITTDRSKQLLIPSVPTVQSVTSSSITLVAVEGCEYSKNGTTWQSSNVFNYLDCGAEYTFYQRYKETSTTYVGKSSEPLVAKTDKGTQYAPYAPTLESKTHNTVTLMAISGYEYSKDGVNWQSSNVFSDLNPETNYMFYQRRAETETHYASGLSSYIIVKTNEQPTYTPGDVNDSGAVTLDDVVSLAQIVAGWQNVTHNEAALDVNGDGGVTLDDVVLLAQFMAGWEVTLS